jgi:hypothetical protein
VRSRSASQEALTSGTRSAATNSFACLVPHEFKGCPTTTTSSTTSLTGPSSVHETTPCCAVRHLAQTHSPGYSRTTRSTAEGADSPRTPSPRRGRGSRVRYLRKIRKPFYGIDHQPPLVRSGGDPGRCHETGSERKHSEADNNPRGPILTVKAIPTGRNGRIDRPAFGCRGTGPPGSTECDQKRKPSRPRKAIVCPASLR